MSPEKAIPHQRHACRSPYGHSKQSIHGEAGLSWGPVFEDEEGIFLFYFICFWIYSLLTLWPSDFTTSIYARTKSKLCMVWSPIHGIKIDMGFPRSDYESVHNSIDNVLNLPRWVGRVLWATSVIVENTFFTFFYFFYKKVIKSYKKFKKGQKKKSKNLTFFTFLQKSKKSKKKVKKV